MFTFRAKNLIVSDNTLSECQFVKVIDTVDTFVYDNVTVEKNDLKSSQLFEMEDVKSSILIKNVNHIKNEMSSITEKTVLFVLAGGRITEPVASFDFHNIVI